MKTIRSFCSTMVQRFLVAALAAVTLHGNAQELVRMNGQRHFKESVHAGNYSGIAHIRGALYALVNDKAPYDGYRLVEIAVDSLNGNITSVADRGYVASSIKNRDMEGVAYIGATQSVLTIGEADSKIIEYSEDCKTVKRQLQLEKGTGNSSYESLCYDSVGRRIYACTEAPLPVDRDAAMNRIRIQAFDGDFNHIGDWMYLMDKPAGNKEKAATYAFGVSELMAYGGDTLLVLEREAYVPKKKIGAWTACKLYSIVLPPVAVGENTDAANANVGNGMAVVKKRLLCKWKTKMNLTRQNFANYEGMCFGPTLHDGSKTIILVADSQNQAHGLLRDWFKTVIVR